MNDLSLVTQVAVLHDKRAFDQLVRKYQSPIRRFFMNHTLGDEQLSDDLAQDTFVKAYLHITSFKGLSGFQTWLFRIAYNVFYDYTRARKQTESIDLVAMKAVNAQHAMLNERMDIYQALQILSENERTCVTFQLMEGLPIDQISKITGLAQGTVKSHLSRGKDKLANYLKQNGYDRT